MGKKGDILSYWNILIIKIYMGEFFKPRVAILSTCKNSLFYLMIWYQKTDFNVYFW